MQERKSKSRRRKKERRKERERKEKEKKEKERNFKAAGSKKIEVTCREGTIIRLRAEKRRDGCG